MNDRDFVLLRHEFGLTRQQGRFLAAILEARVVATSDAVFAAICRDEENPPEEQILKVLACRVRQRLAKHIDGDVIETIWGRGYQIAPHIKAQIFERAGIQPASVERAA